MKSFVILLLSACLVLQAGAQTGKFEKEIVAFEKQDSIQFPAKGQILFTGSSSIRLWDDFNDRYKDYAMVRRGVGGCCLYDMAGYAPRIAFPYRPSKVFLYAGENDIAAGLPADSVFRTFQKLFSLYNDSLPATQFYFISIKPSPSREKYDAQVQKANGLIKQFIAKHTQSHWTFVDVYHAMLGSNGKAMPQLFKPDRLHMLSGGYDIWDKILRKYL